MFSVTVFTACLCDVLGAEPLLGAPSNLHHAAPGENKISLSSQLSLLFVTELKHFSMNRHTQYGRIVVTHNKLTQFLEDSQ